MIKKSLLFIILSLTCELIQAQRKPFDHTLTHSHQISQFITPGFTVLDTINGNLNLDKYNDMILVLKNPKEDTAEYPWEYKRSLILLLGNADNTYTYAARNDNIIPTYEPSNPFGETYEGIEISNGIFTIKQIHGGTSFAYEEEIKFKFVEKNKNWFLFEVVEESWTRKRTVKGIEKADVERKILTQKDLGILPISKYEDWRSIDLKNP